jgi:hypothetical protein|nr:MAG TPA: hypothetical protein [Caudoviricetes sp.]
MAMSPFLRALLEAPGDEEEQNAPADDAGDQNQDAETPDAENTEGDNTEGLDDPFAEDDNNNDNPDNTDSDGENQEEDLSNPPDGLASPDETEDTATTDDGEADEQNIQLNILPLSKLDRLTLKQKCFNNFKDLRVKINRIISLVEDNEQLMTGDFREEVYQELGELHTAVTGYMTTRFSYNNYEENAKNFNILASQFNDLLKKLRDESNYEDK